MLPDRIRMAAGTTQQDMTHRPSPKVDALLPSLHIGVFNQRPLDTVSSSVIIVIMIILWVVIDTGKKNAVYRVKSS